MTAGCSLDEVSGAFFILALPSEKIDLIKIQRGLRAHR